MKILMDTNVLVRFEDEADHHHEVAFNSIDLLIGHGHECVLVPQVLYEFWAVATRPIEVNGLGLDAALTDRVISDCLNVFRILLDERGVFRHWRELVSRYNVRGKNAHDARLVAAMQRHGVANLLTFNGPDFARFPGINVFSPAEIVAGRLPV